MTETAGNIRTIVMLTEDRPGMIRDIAQVILEKGFTMQSHVAGPCEKKGHARFTILMAALSGNLSDTSQVIDALKNLFGVKRAEDITEQKIVAYELAVIKLRATHEDRTRILDLAKIYHAVPIDVTRTRLVLAISDRSDKIDHFCELLKDDIEVTKRTGIVAMISGEAPEQHREPSQELAA